MRTTIVHSYKHTHMNSSTTFFYSKLYYYYRKTSDKILVPHKSQVLDIGQGGESSIAPSHVGETSRERIV